MATATVELTATARQTDLLRAIDSGKYRSILYGGAIRGGKTFGLFLAVTYLASKYPGSRWALVRSDLMTIRRNTLPSWDAFRALCEGVWGPVNQAEWYSDCMNGSRLIFFNEAIEQDRDLNRWRGLEVNGFLLEEANELDERSYWKAVERAGAWFMASPPPPLILMSCNPADNWVRERFYDPWRAGTLEAPNAYIPATPKDNPHLPRAYIESLELMRTESPYQYARFVEGDWDAVQGDAFKREWFIRGDLDPSACKLFFVADIAYTVKSWSSYTAGGVFGVDIEGRSSWFDVAEKRMEIDESIDWVIRTAQDWRHRGINELNVVHVEGNDAYIHALRTELQRRNIGLHVEQLKPHGRNKDDAILSVKAWLPRWRWRASDQWLVNRFLGFAVGDQCPTPKDGPDAMAYACRIVESLGVLNAADWAPKPPTDPWARMRYDALQPPDPETARPMRW